MIELMDVPPLHDPVMVVAFEGWNDAGDAASGALGHLVDLWDPRPIAALDPEDYYDFQVTRPRMVAEGVRRRVQWRTTRVLHAPVQRVGRRDVILVQGIEPSFRWRRFSTEIVELAEDLGVGAVVTLGALMADVAHTREIPVTATSENEATIHRYDLERSTYEGPTGITGVLADAVDQAGLTSISCWVAVPHYAGVAPSPKATLALLARVESLIEVPIDAGALPEAAREWQATIDEIAADDDEVTEYVQALEEAQDTAGLPQASGDAIAREFEAYLRDQGPGGKDLTG